MFDKQYIRIGDNVRIVKKVSEVSSEWRVGWAPAQDNMIGFVYRVISIDWWWNGPLGQEKGSGIIVVDTKTGSNFSFHPDAVEYTTDYLTIQYDKDGYSNYAQLSKASTEIYCKKGESSLLAFYHPHCCGLFEIGGFSFLSVQQGEELIKRALIGAKKYRRGVCRATTVDYQSHVKAALELTGFVLKSKFKNPNTKHIVYEYENRTFNGNVDEV